MNMKKFMSAFVVTCAMMLVPINAGAANVVLGKPEISLTNEWKIYSLEKGTTHRHKVSVNEAGRLSVDFETACGMNKVSLIDSDGVKLYHKEVKGSTSLTDTADIDFDLLPGNYFLQYEHVNEPGVYRVKADFAPAGNNEKEPNDTYSKAMKLELEKPVTGFLTKDLGIEKKSVKVDTADYYSFVVDKEEKMKITYTPDQKNGSFELVNAVNGAMITQRRERAVAASPYVFEMKLKAGTYYICISNNNNSKLEATGSGKYTLLVEPSQKPLKKGDVFTDSKTGIKYTLTSVSKNATAAVSAQTNKAAVSATIPSAIKIGDKTFKVTSIADRAFENCSKLKKVSIGKNVTKIGSKAFNGCKSLTTVTGGKNVTTIGLKAFYKCTALTQVGGTKNSLVLPKVQVIGKQAFAHCNSLKSADISSANLKSIGDSAFNGCKNLTTVSASSKNLTTIGKMAFYNCKKLKQVTMKTTKLSKVGSNAFKGVVTKCVVKVPTGKVKTYKKLLTKAKVGTLLSVKKS